MKKLRSILAGLLITTALVCCTAPAAKTKSKTVNEKLQSYFQRFFIENKDYTFKMVDYPNQSAQGGYLEGYFKGDSVKKMTMRLFGERGQVKYDFYIIDGNDCYAVVTNTVYKSNVYDDPTVKKEYMEEYYIISGEVMVYSPDKNDLIKYQKDDDDVLSAFKDAKAKFAA